MDPSLCSASDSTSSQILAQAQNRILSEACHLCSKIFKNVGLRNRHITRVHKIDVLNPKPTHIICPLCEEENDLKSHKGLQSHLKENHQMSIELMTFEFSSKQEYDTWKDKQKIETNYAMHRSIRKKEHKILYYDCNRSNHKGYKPNYKIRREKSGGTIKMKGVCPSRLICKLRDEGQVSVSYWKTHAGHKEKLRSKHLSKAKEKIVVEKSFIKANLEEEINEFIRQKVGEMNQATDVVQDKSKRSLQWKNLQNLIEGLDDENFNEFMKDIQETVRKFQEKAKKTTQKRKMDKQEYFPFNKHPKMSEH